ncbi:DevR family CRISPR-associated autoregulator [Laspinema sp. D1]|uniref:DevR family CRISPR-associated autoregulator n=1 Tax=Laspinema palackyanum TaxID=3231601 RepID=UPI00346C5F5E|nr:DevR family CRISPR-associated autoregulator [Laspinema sp. D2b]
MANHYLYGTILTGEAVAANNRGDNIGNTTTLQKVFHQDDVHTSVSAEAIRFALRYRFQLEAPESVNRSYYSDKGKLEYKDEKISNWDPNGSVYIDDDLMGFMDAEAATQEKEEELEDESEVSAGKKSKKSKDKPKGKVTKRQSPLAIARAVSLRPYRGELSFNCVSGEKTKGQLSLYSAEMHTTEYQYSFGLNLGDVVNKVHIRQLIEAIIDPPQVAGNHARFAYDFSPASIVLRLTSAHSSRIQNCFEHDELNRSYTLEKLIYRVEAKDIPASELIVGGEVARTEEGKQLKKLGVMVLPGVYAAAEEARKRIAAIADEYQVVAGG